MPPVNELARQILLMPAYFGAVIVFFSAPALVCLFGECIATAIFRHQITQVKTTSPDRTSATLAFPVASSFAAIVAGIGVNIMTSGRSIAFFAFGAEVTIIALALSVSFGIRSFKRLLHPGHR